MISTTKLCTVIWAAWSTLCGVGVIAFGIIGTVAWCCNDQSAPVSIHTNATLLTPIVKRGEPIVYEVMINRLQACKGYISDTFTTTDAGPKTQVIIVRAITSTTPERDRFLRMIISVPPSIRGAADYKSILVSHCPTYDRLDTIIETKFEVVAPPL